MALIKSLARRVKIGYSVAPRYLLTFIILILFWSIQKVTDILVHNRPTNEKVTQIVYVLKLIICVLTKVGRVLTRFFIAH